MRINKDIITQIAFTLIFIFIVARVLGPIFYDYLKRKIPGAYNPDNDIDSMIRRQKERLRAQYGLPNNEANSTNRHLENQNLTSTQSKAPSPEISNLYKETRWGGGHLTKEIQNDITKYYSYTIAESKINSFIFLVEKREYFEFLTENNQKSHEAIKNFLAISIINFILLDEIREKKYFLLDKVAKKCQTSAGIFALALQIKILQILASKKDIKEEKIFSDITIIHQFSEDSIKEGLEMLMKKEANLWAKGPSLYFEELALFFNYASLLFPFPKLESKKDLATAYHILGADESMSVDDIKKIYKKIALSNHPDKITGLKLPKTIERKAILKFNSIQEAYEVIIQSKK